MNFIFKTVLKNDISSYGLLTMQCDVWIVSNVVGFVEVDVHVDVVKKNFKLVFDGDLSIS